MTLDHVITEMYASLCFEPGERPDWQRFAEVVAPNARLVRVNDDGVFELDAATFREDLDGMIDSGALPGFWEGELWRETQQFGDVAHVLSVYEMRDSRNGEALCRAVKSLQLFRRDGRWWISAMLWRREGRDVRVPLKPSVPVSSPRA